MTRFQRVLLILAGCHLLVVALGAMGVDFRSSEIPPARAMQFYGALSGANNRYGFFAPEVQTPSRASFIMTDAQGRQWDDTLAIGSTSESNLRLGTIAFLLPALEEDDQDKMIRSFVATMFGRHPQAVTVEMKFEVYGVWNGEAIGEFPSMKEYREGKRPEWIPVMLTPPYRRTRFVASQDARQARFPRSATSFSRTHP